MLQILYGFEFVLSFIVGFFKLEDFLVVWRGHLKDLFFHVVIFFQQLYDTLLVEIELLIFGLFGLSVGLPFYEG